MMLTVLRSLSIVVALGAPDGPAAATAPVAFTVETADGLEVSGRLYRRGGDALLIYCHSLLRSSERLDPARALDALGPRFDLLAFDFRGHRSSYGHSSVGNEEVLDLRAVIDFAHREGYRRIALLGAGMGATAATRAALLFGNVDALVAVSPSGFAMELTPLIARGLSFLMLDTAYGKFSLRLIANTRLQPREHSGYPFDMATGIEPPPTLVIHAEDDRQVKLEVLTSLLEERFPGATLRLVPGREHAEKLLDDAMLAEIGAFLESAVPEAAATAAPEALPPIAGDCPIPAEIARRELAAHPGRGTLARRLQEVLALRGYVMATVSGPDSSGALLVAAPRIRDIALTGNRRVSSDYLRSVLNLGGGHFNAYELDTAVKRLAGDPAVFSVRETIQSAPDGAVDIELRVKETKPARFFLGAKFTDIDDFYGAGATWNEFNPTGLQLTGRLLYGVEGQRLLNEVSIGRYTFGGTIYLSATHYNMIRSRDELEFVFPRQEVHNVGGEVAVRYRASENVSLQLGAFGQRDREPEGTPVLPVEEGVAAGGVARLDLAGRLPLQGPPWLRWRHTFYFKSAGMFDAGDFSFDTYQWNLTADVPVASHVFTRATAHAGRVTGAPPPQDFLSLGGMHTFPGYEDDAFVNTRMALVSLGLYVSARRLVAETSRWAPLRVIASGRAGTVWGSGLDFDSDRIASDVMFEIDYFELARVGCVIPTGGMRDDADVRFFVGWGEHVQW